MDITQLFKACVKTMRLKNKSILPKTENTSNTISTSKNSNANGKTNFAQKSKGICFQITQLRDFLIENRAAYIKFACHLKRFAQMSDEERDIIDRESENIIKMCKDMIAELKTEIAQHKFNKQESAHVDSMVELLEEYLGSVNKIFTDQKQYRMLRDIESYKLLKLESDKKRIPVTPKTAVDDIKYSETEDLFNASSDGLRHRKAPISSRLSLDDEIASNQPIYNDEELSKDDIQMFESENVQLFNELKGLSEEVEQIEKNVVDIAKLQEIFSEKVRFSYRFIYLYNTDVFFCSFPGNVTKTRHR